MFVQSLQPTSEKLQNASKSLLLNTEIFLGMWATVARSFPGAQNEGQDGPLDTSTKTETTESVVSNDEAKALEKECNDGLENEAKRQMFQTAESAVEAWAMLATSLAGQSFVKSEFEKICFLENRRTDTEVGFSNRDLYDYVCIPVNHVYTSANSRCLCCLHGYVTPVSMSVNLTSWWSSL